MQTCLKRALAITGAVGASAAVAAPTASAINAPIRITEDVNLRAAPNAGSARVGGIYRGTSPSFNCWAEGQNIGGVNVWFNVTVNGATGFYASKFDDSSYRTNGEITGKYGIPPCGSAPPSPAPASAPSSASQTAINWARGFADRRDRSYNGLCLKWVFDAYAAAGVNLRPWVTTRIGSNTYPQDIWVRFNHGRSGGGTPPAGALVFWRSRSGNRTQSHVALSLGGDNLVSTSDSVAGYTHYETLSQHSYAVYLGWWLPV